MLCCEFPLGPPTLRLPQSTLHSAGQEVVVNAEISAPPLYPNSSGRQMRPLALRKGCDAAGSTMECSR